MDIGNIHQSVKVYKKYTPCRLWILKHECATRTRVSISTTHAWCISCTPSPPGGYYYNIPYLPLRQVREYFSILSLVGTQQFPTNQIERNYVRCRECIYAYQYTNNFEFNEYKNFNDNQLLLSAFSINFC